MNLYGTYLTQKDQGFLTPRVSFAADANTLVSPSKSYDMVTTRLQGTAGTQQPEAWWSALPKYAAAAPVDVLDSLAALYPGMKRGQVNDSVYDALGMPGFAQWVRDNQGGVEIASGLLGATLVGATAEVAAAKLITSGWFAATRLGQAAAPAINLVANAKRAAVTESLAAAGRGEALSWFQGANRTYVLAKTGQGIAKAATSELAIMAALHENSFVWSDDMQTNMVMAGLGLGIGGTLGGIAGRGLVTRWANREVMKQAFADAADPGNYERIMATTPIGSGLDDSLSELRGPVKSAEFTTLMLNATRDDASAAAAAGTPVARARNEIQTRNQATALQVLQTMTRRGIGKTTGTEFNVKATGAGAHIIQATRDDPLLLLGATELGAMKPGSNPIQLVTERQEGINAVLKDKGASKAEIKLAKLQQKETPLFIVGKHLMTAEEASDIVGYESPVFKTTAKNAKELTWQSPYSGKKLTLREDGRLSTDYLMLHPQDQLAVVEGMNHMLKKIDKITVPKNPSFMELDFAAKFEDEGGIVDWTKNAGIRDSEQARVKSLQLKSDIADKMMESGKPFDVKARISLNLPFPTRLESATDPTGDGLRAVIRASKRDHVSYKDLQELRVKAMKQLDIGTDATLDSRLDGDIWNFNRNTQSAQREWLPPLVATYTDPSEVKTSRFDLNEMVAEQKALSLGMLTNTKRSKFANQVAQAITQSPVFKQISEISGLDDVQIGGTKTSVGATASQFLTQAQRFRNNPTLLGAQVLRRVVNRMTEIYVDNVQRNLKPLVDNLASVSGQRSRALFSQYASFSPGWDIERVIPSSANSDMWAFKLAKTDSNAAKLGRLVDDADTLKSPNGVEVVLDKLGNDFRIAFEQQATDLLKERNLVRAARGLDEIEHKGFYIPPPDTRNKVVGFTLDAANRPVPNGTIVANTREEFNSMAAKLRANLKPGQRFVTKEEVEDFVDLWDQANMDWVNPTQFVDPQTLAGRSGPQRGLLQSNVVNPRAVDDVLQFLKRGYEQTTNGVVRTAFDSQLKIARIRDAASTMVEGTKPGVKTIWRTFEDTLMGISAMSDPRGLNVPLAKVDKWMDETIKDIWPAARVSSNYLRDVEGKLGRKLRKVDSFADLADQLGPHMPFASAQDYLDYKHGIKAPWTTKEMARAANRFGAGIILRWLEIPQAVMNMAGIITSMPAVMTAKNVPTIGKIGGVNVVDQFRIMARGFQRQFERGTRDWEMMVRNGDTSQDVAELHHQLSLLDGKSNAMKILTGDPSKADWAKLTGSARTRAYLQFKGIEGMASILTDTSENMSRRWAHFVGLELADYHGITGLEARHNFARQIANDSIANYDPLNRPEIYQSAFGSMYGLFLSYAQNYYERLFRWMEVGDYKSIGKSAAFQASMFGFTSVPGYRQLESLLGGEEDGNGVLDGVYKRFGPATADFLAHGSFDQWVKILSLGTLPAVSLHTRGDTNFRSPAIDFATGVNVLPVGLEALKDLITGAFEGIGSMVDPSQPHSARHMAEIMARNMPSRMLRGVITVLANGGQEADMYGNLMSETQGAAESVYRMLGLRSGRQQAEIEAYFMNQKSLAIDAARMDKVRAATRAIVRSGKYEDLTQVFEDYVAAGGKPWNYPQWIQGIVREANNTRGQNQLMKMLRDPAHQDLARRLQLMMAPY